jgi:hypothetical protein
VSRGIVLLSAFFLKKMFRDDLSLTEENHHFIVQIGKKLQSLDTNHINIHNTFGVGLAGITTF